VSALEPDAPAPHVWPHWRSAVRSWWAHRGGHEPSASRVGRGGKPPALGDVLRVGQILADLGMLDRRGELTRHGKAVVTVAFGATPRSNLAVGAQGAQVLVRRLERHLRRKGIVAKASPRWVTKRIAWTDPNDGRAAETRVIVERA
jgi:hypothetical protein